MRCAAQWPAWLLCLLPYCSSFGQGTFQNLGFESANVTNAPPYQPVVLPIGNVLPGWRGYVGANPVSQVFLNGYSLGSALMSLISTNKPDVGNRVIAGTYSATLAAGLDAENQNNGIVSAALAQTGFVPGTARSVRFGVSPLWPDGIENLSFEFNGVTLPFFALANRGNYVEYGVDITAMAGMTGEMRFTERPITRNNPAIILDRILFSDFPIPEPTMHAVLALSLALFGWRSLKRRNKV